MAVSSPETGSGKEGQRGGAPAARRAILSAATDLGDAGPAPAAPPAVAPAAPPAARPADASLDSESPRPSASPEAPGRARIGIYEVQEEIGRGGMGAVYRAWHPARRGHVALKVIHPHLADGERSERLRQAFLREGGVLMSVAHENIVSCYDVNETAHEGRPALYMALELLEGETLARRLERGPLAPAEALRVARALARALEALHGHTPRVLHRDLKPANVFLTAGGGTKLLDFGLAAVADWKLTQVSAFAAGSRPYMAPEQFDGLRQCTERSDLYSLGVTLFQALTGRCPFEAETDQGFYEAHREQSPPALVEAHPGLERGPLSEALENVVTRLLAKRPEERYASAADLLADLERAGRGAAVEKPKVTRPETVRFRRRLSRATIAVALLALAAVAGAVAIRGSATYRLRGAEEAYELGDLATAGRVVAQVLEADPGNEQARALDGRIRSARAEADRQARFRAVVLEAEAALARDALDEAKEAIVRADAVARDGAEKTAVVEPLQRAHAARVERARAAAERRRAVEAQGEALAKARAALDEGRRDEAATALADLERAGIAPELAEALSDARRDVGEAEGIAAVLRSAEAARKEGRPGAAAGLARGAVDELMRKGAALERRAGWTAVQAAALAAACERDVALEDVRRAVATRDPEKVRRALAAAGDRIRPDDPERVTAQAILHDDAIARAAPALAEGRFEDVDSAAREALRSLPPGEAGPFRDLARTFEAEKADRGDPAARDGLREGLRALPRAERAWLLLERAVAERGRDPGERLVPRLERVELGSADADDRNPTHTVDLAPFYIDATEVTTAAYAEVVVERRPRAGRERHPVCLVSFAEAKAYAAARKARLPTADEWEAAASVDPRPPVRRRKYPWGDDWPHAAAARAQEPRAVGTLDVDLSAAGCLDMGGNVTEWTTAPGDPARPVLQGGACTLGGADPQFFRAAARSPASGEPTDDIGFRCARDASVPDLREFAGP